LDALFTATSAACSNGLATRDTATQFTTLGHIILAVLIQTGGITTLFITAIIVSNAFGLPREPRYDPSSRADHPPANPLALLRRILLLTAAVELVAAASLIPVLHPDLSWKQRLWPSLFQSISAFCNAGFSLDSNSIEPYRSSPLVHLTLLTTCLIGGLGLPVLQDLWITARNRFLFKNNPQSLKTQYPATYTRWLITTTAAIYLTGFLAITAAQLKPCLNDFFQQGFTANRVNTAPPSWRTITAACADANFTAISAQGAGFTTIPIDQLSPASRFTVLITETLVATPSGIGGGITTIACAVLSLTAIRISLPHTNTPTPARPTRIPAPLVKTCIALTVGYLALVSLATFLLCLSEPYPLGKILSEAVSAASNTGLSLGITGDMTRFGKSVVLTTMFIGRVSPMLIVLSQTHPRSRPWLT
jgi:trk system potassium uptake protein TrkH